MAKSDAIFLYIGTYTREAAARADYNAIKDPLSTIVVGTYDAALVTKDASGKMHVNKEDVAAHHGTWGGAVAGASIGIVFPRGVIASAAIGAAAGAIGGHLWRGLSRSRVKELGELIDSGEAALLLIGGNTLEAAIGKLQLKARKTRRHTARCGHTGHRRRRQRRRARDHLRPRARSPRR